MIVPISDEDPQDGDGCFASDTDAVNNAIAQTKANDVAVSPIVAELGEGNCDSDDCTCTVNALSGGRDFNSRSRATASASSARAATPYTVSVGKPTR